MSRLLFITILVLSLLAANAWQYRQIQAQAALTASAEQSARTRLATIHQLQDSAAERAVAEKDLARSQLALRTTLMQREQQIKELERENLQYRNWAATHLPDTTQRLRRRPAFTSARDYQQWLMPQSDALPAARHSAHDQRRSE